jgi:hypothetical protein
MRPQMYRSAPRPISPISRPCNPIVMCDRGRSADVFRTKWRMFLEGLEIAEDRLVEIVLNRQVIPPSIVVSSSRPVASSTSAPSGICPTFYSRSLRIPVQFRSYLCRPNLNTVAVHGTTAAWPWPPPDSIAVWCTAFVSAYSPSFWSSPSALDPEECAARVMSRLVTQ